MDKYIYTNRGRSLKLLPHYTRKSATSVTVIGVEVYSITDKYLGWWPESTVPTGLMHRLAEHVIAWHKLHPEDDMLTWYGGKLGRSDAP